MSYQQKKELIRQRAIDWQREFTQKQLYASELADWGLYFEIMGRRYGLLREFRENGII